MPKVLRDHDSRSRFWLSGSLAIALTTGLLSQPGAGVQLSDGRVAFEQVPQLVSARTYEKSVGSLIATYYFTFTVPATAGVGLQRLTLSQSQGTSKIRFNLAATKAYRGDRPGQPIGVQAVQEPETGTVNVSFDPAIAPGETVTLALSPRMNPTTAGTYLFGITVFPQGEKPQGQFIGFARLQFYNTGGRGFN